jgi:4-amino-4-deoxy-L-arabinose transferase-like glycosyltransferase
MPMNRRLLLILLLALVLRLGFGLAQDPLEPYSDFGGDTGWYLANAYALIMGRQPGEVLDTQDRFSPINMLNVYTVFTGRGISYITKVSQISTPPLYLIIIGVPQALLSPAGATIAVRIFQALLSTATCYFAYHLALRLTRRENAGLLAALLLAVSPVFIIEAAQILTETVFIFLLVGGVWLYVESVVRARDGLALLVLAAFFLGTATLTRAVLLAFPFGLALHLLLVYGWRKGLQRATLFLIVYALVVSTWTIYTATQWNRFVVAGEGLPAFLYLGTMGWSSAQEVDQALAEQSATGDYIEAASNSITANPLGWVQRRVGELGGAYLQPHGTTFFGGASLRDLALDWLREDRSPAERMALVQSDLALKWLREERSPAELIALVQSESFIPKLILYLFHYGALVAGAVGIWRTRRCWQVSLPMIGLIGYITLVHLVLYALPRYLFPTEVFFYVFAAASFFRLSSQTQGTR